MENLPNSYFIANIQKYGKLVDSFQEKANLFSILRISSFILFAVSLIYFANIKEPGLIAVSVLVFLVVFVPLVYRHTRVKYLLNHYKYLTEINEGDLKRRDGHLADFDPGNEFRDDGHPYSEDLDVFGKNSLFQLINRTVTIPGRNRIGAILKNPFQSKSGILARQVASKELSGKIDWVQEFQARGHHFKIEDFKEERFNQWMSDNELGFHRGHQVLRFLLPSVFILITTLVILSILPYQVLYLLFFINGIYIARTLKRVSDIANYASESLNTLKAYKSLLAWIEDSQWKSPLLAEYQEKVNSHNKRASQKVQSLVSYCEKLDSRTNIFYWIINFIFLLDIHWIMQLHNWKSRYAETAKEWFSVVNDFEVLVSFGASANINKFSWPEIKDEAYYINFNEAGHPLIDPRERVHNNFETSGKGTCLIITGSNMSGKSTFLRTVGINLVMAYCGGPVCAKKSSLSIFNVFSGMRTRDDLSEHVSSFYAELKRIKELLDRVEKSDIPYFYILDEILKGTNSGDRHNGAESLILQLIDKNCLGMISTHDIELGSLEKRSKSIHNFNFSSTIDKDEIIFDYKLKEGVCKSFNASKLMEKMGIIIKN